jgi:hypothetical protein
MLLLGRLLTKVMCLSLLNEAGMTVEDILNLFQAPMLLTWKMLVMMVIGSGLVFLAIAKDYEPLLLLPIGFGAILANLPLSGIAGENGLLGILYNVGIKTEIFPLLLFIGLGAMTDFGPWHLYHFINCPGSGVRFRSSRVNSSDRDHGWTYCNLRNRAAFSRNDCAYHRSSL